MRFREFSLYARPSLQESLDAEAQDDGNWRYHSLRRAVLEKRPRGPDRAEVQVRRLLSQAKLGSFARSIP